MPLLSWKITNICNYRCLYHPCMAKEPEMDTAPAVLEFLRNAKTSWEVSITGGEPFLYPRFVEICREISLAHVLSIDTNLSLSPVIADFAKEIDPTRVELILAALHVEEREKQKDGMERFIRDAQLLLSKGFHVKVVYVLYPPLIPRFEQDVSCFQSHGIALVPKPFKGDYQGKIYPTAYEEDAYRIFSKYGKSNLREKVIYDFKGIPCKAGKEMFNLHPDGRITRCSSDHTPIGRLGEKDPNDALLPVPQPCRVSECYCFGANYALLDAGRLQFLQGIQGFMKMDFPGARTSFQRAVELQPDLDSAYYNLAFLEVLADRSQLAIPWLKKAISASPDNPDYTFLLDQIEAGSTCMKDLCRISTDLSYRE